MTRYKVAEIFASINGEGRRAGETALFIRLAGCNLQCGYCDTAWANREDTPVRLMTLEEIREAAAGEPIRNITLTGGEPLMAEGAQALLRGLAGIPGSRIEVETNGSIGIRPFFACGDNISFTMDYKLPGSGQEDRMCMANLTALRTCDSIKFVVSDITDCMCAGRLIREYGLDTRCCVFFSPVFGRIRPREIVNFMLQNNLNDVKLQLQLHKYIWDPDARGV